MKQFKILSYSYASYEHYEIFTQKVIFRQIKFIWNNSYQKQKKRWLDWLIYIAICAYIRRPNKTGKLSFALVFGIFGMYCLMKLAPALHYHLYRCNAYLHMFLINSPLPLCSIFRSSISMGYIRIVFVNSNSTFNAHLLI